MTPQPHNYADAWPFPPIIRSTANRSLHFVAAHQLLIIHGAVVRLCMFHQHAQQVIIVAAGSIVDHRLDVLVIPSLLACRAPELRKRSMERIAADKEYAYVREDIEQFKKQQADKTLSLNEKLRLKEQEEIEARMKARDKERLTRPEPQEKVYELTLKQAALPGLPPPVTKTNAALAKLSAQAGPGIPGASTNSAFAATGAAPGGDSLDEAEAEKPAAQDAPLLEARHILVDYLSVLPKGNLVTAGH